MALSLGLPHVPRRLWLILLNLVTFLLPLGFHIAEKRSIRSLMSGYTMVYSNLLLRRLRLMLLIPNGCSKSNDSVTR